MSRNTRLTVAFNAHFGVDVTSLERTLILMRADDIAAELGIEDGESDEHFYAAIESVLAERI